MRHLLIMMTRNYNTDEGFKEIRGSFQESFADDSYPHYLLTWTSYNHSAKLMQKPKIENYSKWLKLPSD